mmetsp:Transcript_28170/g.45258  ORF Transcript_28170/g.45258 Transcript_28170/m.45258 type:complete len:209 (+) Transcript_28170:51-677(+)
MNNEVAARPHGVPLGRTVILVNNFIVETTDFLNRFLQDCESRINELSGRITRTETFTSLLEAKLNTIPEIGGDYKQLEQSDPVDLGGKVGVVEQQHKNIIVENASIPAKYSKLLQMGMPMEHVKLKMESEGLDTSALLGGTEEITGQYDQLVEQEILDSEQPGDEEEDVLVDEELGKYVKMLKMGIPKASVQQKMTMEGVDPSKLDSL